jgi:pentapeptide repeat protein
MSLALAAVLNMGGNMRTVIAADASGFTTAIVGFAGLLVGALATILVGIVNYRGARSGRVTDRLTKAVEQLGNSNPQVRMGAIYELEQIARDSKATLIARWRSSAAAQALGLARSPERSTASRHRSYVNYVATLLAALVRSQSRLSDGGVSHGAVLKVRAPDAQAALTVLCRPPVCDDHVKSGEKGWLDLSRSDLSRARLRGAQLQGADLSYVQLQGTDLKSAKLQGAILKEAKLGPAPGSRWRGGANLRDANLTGADLTRADLNRASLANVNLTGADLTHADLNRASLANANLTNALLIRANLTSAVLDGAILDGAIWSRSTRWPEKELSQIQARSTKISRDRLRIDGPRAAKAGPHLKLVGPPASVDLEESADRASASR